ncbi:lectin-like protein, partial [Prosthecobacter sp.]|uniref:lectin-like protein n=1 Tax=Prosthecobacter sp. TaxID=1965333 RepID=UPI001D5EFEC0
MQTDREVRYQSATDLRRDLDTILTLPRAALIAQQQAAAEATARATQAQKQAASGPQRRMPEQTAHHAPPTVKKSSLGPVIGIAATIVLVAGLVYVFKPPAKKPVRQTTASTSDNKPPAPVPKSAPVLTPAPNGSAGFSNFAPTAQWRDEMAGTDSWGPAWQRADGEMHVVASMNGMRLFADLRRDSALRVRFRARRDDASLNLIQRLNKVGIGPRYLVTIRTKANIDGSLDMLPMKKDGDKRTLAPLKSNPPLGTGTEHTAEFYAIGKRLAFFFDGQLLSEAPESTLTEGFPGVFASHGIELIVVETAVLDQPTSNPPPVEVLAFGGHRYQFSPEKLNWEEAKAKAATTGGHLATITSQEENQWVLDTFVSKLPGGLSLWLGGTNDNPTRQWTWITGEPFTFTAWGAGEPGTNPNEPVLCFSQMNMGWGDIRTNGIGNADRRGGYLIEWDDASTKPMPASPAPVAIASTLATANLGIPPGWTDLLADVDVQRDTVSGKWEMTPDGLILKRERGVKVLEFNHSPPEEYDFEIEFTISEGSDVSQVLSVAGHSLRWKMAQGSPPTNFCSFGPMLDGLSPVDPKRTEAVLKRERLKTGQRYRSTVEVRRGSLRALIDGEEVLQWSGNLERLGDEKSTSVKNGKHLGLACYATGVTFHSAVMRPAAGGPSVPSPAMPVVASAPTTGGASATGKTPKSEPPAPPSDPHLAKLESGFNARYESDVQKPFLVALTALNKSYLANGVAKARAAAQSRGSLKEVIAFDEVKARIERGEGVPEVDEPGTPESLKSLRSIYRNALAKITAERDARAAPLYDIYVSALDAYITELIKATKLDEARQVKVLRTDIASKKPTVAVVAEAPEPAPPPPPTTDGAPSPSTPAKMLGSGSSWRTAADFLVANGGSFVAAKNGGIINVSTPEEIPSGRFDILELTLNRDRSVLPPLKDADFAAFAGLRDLRRVHIRPAKPSLSDAAFAFLSSNSDLTWVNLDGVPDVTDAVLAHLAGARKLDYLSIQNAGQFTGRGLDKLACTSSLTTLEVMGSGLSDDGMRALANFRKLLTLHMNSKSVTDVGFAALAEVSSLNALNLTGTTFGDESAGSLAKLTKLTSLDLSDTKITDLGLKKLLPLKKLTSIRLNGTAVTLEAAADFQKQMPQCKVSR